MIGTHATTTGIIVVQDDLTTDHQVTTTLATKKGTVEVTSTMAIPINQGKQHSVSTTLITLTRAINRGHPSALGHGITTLPHHTTTSLDIPAATMEAVATTIGDATTAIGAVATTTGAIATTIGAAATTTGAATTPIGTPVATPMTNRETPSPQT